MEPTLNTLRDYFSGKKATPIYKEVVEIYDGLRIHANGEYPQKLIEERRPHESDYLHVYRKKIYKSKTKEVVGSVTKSLGKIRRSTDWNIKYDTKAVPPGITEEETLEKYCEYNFPYYSSMTGWSFAVLLKIYLIDPNALIVVSPLNKPENNEYLKPYPVIFNSDQVLEYTVDEMAILKSKDCYQSPDSNKKDLKKWYVITTDSIITYAEIDSKKNIAEVDRYQHNLGYLPIIKMRGVYLKSHEEYSINESRISDMVPSLDEAVREYSDQQANIVNHLFPERWEFATQNCDACRNEQGISLGKIRTEIGAKKTIRMVECSKCNGTGIMNTSGPYKKFIVRPTKQNMGEQAPPMPPFGYVSKDATIIEVVDKRIATHKYEALCAINMQFLMQIPLNESGYAKEVDRDELNNFVHGVAEDIVFMMDGIYKIICDYRYGIIVADKNKRTAMLPKIAVPDKFDLIDSNYLVEELGKGKNAGMSGVIIAGLELEYCEKKFFNNPEIRDELKCVFELDPMLGTTEDEKMVRYQNGGVTKEDYIVSCNIIPFVKRAIQENQEFLDKEYDERMKIIRGYATVIMQAQQKQMIQTPGPQPAA